MAGDKLLRSISLTVIGISLPAIVWMAGAQDWIESTTIRRGYSLHQTVDPARDPVLGLRLDVPHHDVFGRPTKANKSDRCIVVALGGCTSCSVNKVDFRELANGKADKIYLLFTSPKEEIQKHFQNGASKLFFCKVGKNVIEDVLNATVTPRAYCVNSNFEITRLEPITQSFESFMAEVN